MNNLKQNIIFKTIQVILTKCITLYIYKNVFYIFLYVKMVNEHYQKHKERLRKKRT